MSSQALVLDPKRIRKLLPYLLYVLFAAYTSRKVWSFLQRFRTPLRRLPGPPAASLVLGNTLLIHQNDDIPEVWRRKYGDTYVTRLIFGSYRLDTLDPRAISHILSHSDVYVMPEVTRELFRYILGGGLLAVEGDVHRRQRRIANPSFAPSQIRELTPIFFDVAHSLRDVLNGMLDAPSRGSNADRKEVEIYSWMARAALDIIGLAGFDYQFDTLHSDKNELAQALTTMIQCSTAQMTQALLRHRITGFHLLPTKVNKIMQESTTTINRIGMDLVQTKKAALQKEMRTACPVEKSTGGAEKAKFQGRDLLTSLIRANMATDLPERQRMSDQELLAQIITFLVAGHETTGASVSWTLHSLAQNPSVQQKLRDEVLSVADDAPSMDELNALPYLDKVVKETLRFHAPLVWSIRRATAADEIPLSRPVKDKYGNPQSSIRIQKGDFVSLQSRAVNRSERFWGKDAMEFRPERWDELSTVEGTKDIPGIFAHTLTFLGGQRACIGYRFAIIEMKAFLFTLLREFEFSAVPGQQLRVKNLIVARPVVEGEEKKGTQLPLIISRLRSRQ